MTERGTGNNNHNSLCLNSHQFMLRYRDSMCTWLHWMHQNVVPVQRDFLVSSFIYSLLSVYTVAGTSICPSCTPWPTTWTLALHHVNYRLVHAEYMYLCIYLYMCSIMSCSSHAGFNTGGGDVNFYSIANHVPVLFAS